MLESYSKLARILIALLLVAGLCQAESKISSDLPRDAHSNVNVIVRFRHAPEGADHERMYMRGAALRHDLHFINADAYSLPASELENLAADPDVEYISADRQIHGALDYSAETINANIAFQAGFDGKGVGVAIIDSGISLVPDLNGASKRNSSRVVYSESFLDGSSDTSDRYGHGTHVAGIVAGDGMQSTGGRFTYTFRGVAPNAQIINLKVLDDKGVGTDSAVIAAINRAISLRNRYNIRVINLSLGRRVFESYKIDPLCQAVEAAWKAGIVVVTAAGNDGRDNSLNTHGYGTINVPGNDPYVITVGAMKTMDTPGRSDDVIASYSSKGPTLIDHVVKPDLVAPGNRIIALRAPNGWLDINYPQNLVPMSWYTRSPDAQPSAFYFQLSGTSMSAAMVTGTAALMLEKDPSLTPDQVKARIMKTASKAFPAVSLSTDPVTETTYQDQYDIFTVGAGYLDVWAALNNSDKAAGSALSPTAVYDAATGTVSVLFDSSQTWGSSPAWSTSVIWGGSVFQLPSSVVWSGSVIWGDITAQDFSVIWGTSVIWGGLVDSVASSASVDVLIYGDN
jgi:serine protease AprX